METFQFQAESRRLLDLMIHSLYSNKDIFLRELISNSSDAIDKLKFDALTQPELQGLVDDPHIRITPDKEAGTLTVSDNGVGMSRDEVIEYIGSIARSGTQEFTRILQENKGAEIPPELIGQFGVGFYSSFMVADKITLLTRKAGEEKATRWESAGDGSYTIDEAEKETCGTDITLHLKPAGEENDQDDYTQEWKIRQIVTKYSDYVAYPIRTQVERKEIERDEEGKPKEGAEEQTVISDEVLNSMKAIWTRPADEVSDEDYNEFYKHISHDWTDPLERVTLKAEGTFEFRALMFIPSKAPMDMFWREGDSGLQLYIRRVFIMSDCKELIPEYLRFMRGVVDAEDLSLNVSREILQQDRQVRLIRKRLTGKILDTINDLREKEPEKFETFWKEFGKVVKEGLFNDRDNQDRIFEFARFRSTHDPEGWTTLGEYIDRMKDGQDKIYHITGKSLDAVKDSPHLEAFREKGYEVLYLVDPVDEIWTQSVFQYKEKSFQPIGKGAVELGDEEEKKKAREENEAKEKELKTFIEYLQKTLDEHIKEVRLSTRLTQSPACLVGDMADMTPQMEELLRAAGQDTPKTKRILEINGSHPLIEKMKNRYDENSGDEWLNNCAELIYGQALLAESNLPPDPAKFSKSLAELMARAV